MKRIINKDLLLAIVLIFICTTGIAKEKMKNLNRQMSQIASTVVTMFPLINAHRPLSTSEAQELSDYVSRLQQYFKQSRSDIFTRSDTFQISYNLVLGYLARINSDIKNQQVDIARRELLSLGEICTSCHTQDTRSRTIFPGVTRETFDSDLAMANFSFMTRDYKNAVLYYDKYLHSKQQKTELDLMRPLQALLTIYVQIYNTPALAAKQLAKYRDLKDQTRETRKHLEGWITGLSQLGAVHNLTNFKDLKVAVNKYLGNIDQLAAEMRTTPEEQATRVWLRGQLYHFLNTHPPRNEIPEILYWLSLCDRSLGYNYNFSLADLYLKQCINTYPDHPYAKKCYHEYRAFVDTMYSGAGGSFIPLELEVELDKLRKKITH